MRPGRRDTVWGFLGFACFLAVFNFNALLKVQNALNTKDSEAWMVWSGDVNPPVRKWAYAYLAGGCSSDIPEHIGFIANIAAAAQSLQSDNSTADVVALIQMSYDSKDETLPENEARLLQSLPNVKVKYIPRVSSKVHQNFYVLMMEKFRILDLTEYSRVIFMDGDLFPKRSLDYLFELSEPSSDSDEEFFLQENVIITGKSEPAQGGFFMLKPNHLDYLRAQVIIRKAEEAALDLPWPHWDSVLGWGHVIDSSDEWQMSIEMERQPGDPLRTNWSWHGSFADQGFLYHWVKYEKKNVSIITNDKIETYSSIGGEMQELRAYRNNGKFGVINRHTHYEFCKRKRAPMCDFQHFAGSGKPWFNHNRKLKHEGLIGDWFSALEAAEKIANVTLEFPNSRHPPLGKFPVFQLRMDHIKLKAKSNWTMYV